MPKNKIVLLLIIFIFIFISITACTKYNNYYTLNIDIDTQKGEVNYSPDKDGYKENEKVNIEVTEKNGWEFTNWSGDISSSKKNIELIMDSDKTIKANFEKINDTITTNIKGAGEVKEEKINGERYLISSAADGFILKNWQDENQNIISTKTQIKVKNINTDEIIAFFALERAVEFEGKGEIISQDYGEGYFEITVEPKNRYYFSNWSGIQIDDIITSSNYRDPLSAKYIKIKKLSGTTLSANFSEVQGGFKFINSWGDNWGYSKDGAIYMSYAAAINTNLRCRFFAPQNNYEPKLVAEFKINGLREDISINFIKKNDGEEITRKSFYPNVEQKSGEHYFPDNKIVLDITELLPFSTDNLVMQVTNSSDSIIEVDDFSIRYFQNYSIDDLSESEVYYSQEDFPFTVKNSIIAEIAINNLTIEKEQGKLAFINQQNLLDEISRKPTEVEIENMAVEKSNEINNYSDYGRGLKTPDKNLLKKLVNNNKIKILDSTQYNLDDSLEQSFDHSKSSHFPPVGNQLTENSCVAWSMAYYIQTFYNARENNWDLSDMYFDENNNFVGDSSKIMSPDFVYHLINNGGNNATYPTDALDIIEHIGVSSWQQMPYDANYYSNWPDEIAWREAAKNRSNYYEDEGMKLYYLEVNDIEDIKFIKNLLAEGYLCTVSVDSSQYEDDEGNIKKILTVENYKTEWYDYDHANTLVGYDDNL